MPAHSRWSHPLRSAAQDVVVAALCVTLVAPPAMFAEPGAPTHPAAAMPQNQRVLHALNRFTFGPRSGDVAAVEKMGLDRWFEQQLHPERIDDAAFEAKLAQFPAMRLSQEQLIARFPPPQVLRQMSNGNGSYGLALPSDPVERAIYADAERSYSLKRDQQGQNQQNMTDAQKGMQAQGMDPGDDPAQGKAPAMTAPGDDTMAVTAVARNGKGNARRALGVDAPDEVEAVFSMPPAERFQRLVAMSPDEMIAFRNGVKPRDLPRLFAGLTPEQTESVAAMQGPARVVAAGAVQSRLLRDVYSDRQFEAVMTDFWLNHFSVFVGKSQNEPYYLPDYLRQTVLPHALGRFEDLLVATAKSPAMLVYLDNWESIGPNSLAAARVRQIGQMRPNGKIAKAAPKGINENYARELMELHTLGVNGGYTQQDVIEVAKCFTGWTIDRPAMGGSFEFEPNRHEPGMKTVLGHTIQEGGIDEGLQVLHILATSPATARFVSHKLAVRFVSDNPPAAIEQAMTDAYLKTGGDIRAVLTAMYRSPAFWSADVFRAKVKTPIEFVASALRASNASVANALPLAQAMQRLGMPVYGMQTPNGYSWMSDEWVSSNALLTRMNFALVLSGDRLPGTQTDWPAVLGGDASAGSPTPQTEAELEMLLLGQPAAPKTRSTVLEQFSNPDAQKQAEESYNAQLPEGDSMMAAGAGKGGLKGIGGKRGEGTGLNLNDSRPATPLDTMAGLLLGSPDFQRR